MCDGFCNVSESAGASPANWPEPCRRYLRVAIHPGFATSNAFRNVDFKDIARRALNAWEKVIGVRFIIVDEYTESGSEIFMRPQALPGSTLADSYLARNTCATSLRQRYDTVPNGPWSEGMLYSTIVHEVGHALGLNHERDSRASLFFQINAAWKDPHSIDIAQARRLGYGAPLNEPPIEPPIDPPIEPPIEPPPNPPKDDRNTMAEFLKILITALLSNIGDCERSQGRTKLAKRIKGRDALIVWRLERITKATAIKTHGRKWWRSNGDQTIAVVLDEYERASEAELDEIIAAATEVDDDDDE